MGNEERRPKIRRKIFVGALILTLLTTAEYKGIVGTSAELAAKGQFPMATLTSDGTITAKTINFTTAAVGGKTYQISLSWSDLNPVHPPILRQRAAYRLYVQARVFSDNPAVRLLEELV